MSFADGVPPHADWSTLKPRARLLSRDEVLELAVRLAYGVSGNIIEFGVAEGHSTRTIRKQASRLEKYGDPSARKRIFACDSFEGLQERFENAQIGAFKTTPPVIDGVTIVKGFFEQSLTEDLAKEVGWVALASLDADLYSSTLCALNWLTPMLQTGSLLLFDEFLGERESERRAFLEWSAQTGCRTILIATFAREPSGWGNMLDQRALYQVVKDAPLAQLQPVQPSLAQRGWRKLRALAAR